MNNKEHLGNVVISEGAIELIVGIATTKTKGVHSIQGLLKPSVTDLLSHKLVSKGIQISKNEDNSFTVNIYVALKYGVNVKETSELIQNRIKEQVLFMCDQVISQVNVFVTKLVYETGEKGE